MRLRKRMKRVVVVGDVWRWGRRCQRCYEDGGSLNHHRQLLLMYGGGVVVVERRSWVYR